MYIMNANHTLDELIKLEPDTQRIVLFVGIAMYKKELSTIALIVLFLLPVASQAFTTQRSLVAGESYAVYRDANAGWKIQGSFVSTNDIEFFICDVSNYTNWRAHEPVVRYNYSESTLGELINFTIPYASVWYVVFSPVGDRGVDSLEVEVNYVDQSDVTQTQVSWVSHNPELDNLMIGFAGALVAIGLIAVLGVIWKTRFKH